MKTKLRIPEADIQKVCLEYYTNYGTTMAGLVVSHLHIPWMPAACASVAVQSDVLACIKPCSLQNLHPFLTSFTAGYSVLR